MKILTEPPYEYKVIVKKCFDADTILADVDLGHYVWLKDVKYRLYGINAPETRTSDPAEKARGMASKEFLRNLIEGKEVIIKVFKKQEKYGRFLAIIYANGVCVNDLLLKKGLAKENFYE